MRLRFKNSSEISPKRKQKLKKNRFNGEEKMKSNDQVLDSMALIFAGKGDHHVMQIIEVSCTLIDSQAVSLKQQTLT